MGKTDGFYNNNYKTVEPYGNNIQGFPTKATVKGKLMRVNTAAPSRPTTTG